MFLAFYLFVAESGWEIATMAHPKETKRLNGRLWHLEDQGLTKVDAGALKRHLIRTEDKRARLKKSKSGYEVWWAK